MSSLLPTSNISSIENHVRSYRSALKSNLEVTVHSLSASHLKMHSLLHPLGANQREVDFSALVYSLDRLPKIIDESEKIILAQSPEIFEEAGYKNVANWKRVESKSRRRVAHFNSQKNILAYFIASVSDIDDIVNILITLQTEWNKFNQLFHKHYSLYSLFKSDLASQKFFQKFKVTPKEWQNFISSLGPNWDKKLKKIYKSQLNLKIQLLSASWLNYTKSTQKWWKNIATTVSPAFHISHQEIYFVSSNNHSLLNAFTGFPLAHQFEILSHLKIEHPSLYQTWTQIQSKESLLNPNDFIYFASKYFLSHPEVKEDYQALQKKLGILTIPNANYLDLTVQIFPVKNLVKSAHIDPRLKIKNHLKINQSDALIFNIDYPLGFSAYHVLTEIMENVKNIKGVYILGKAAILNGEIGDIQIPRLVFDEHTQNSYLFKNCFSDNFPYINNQGSILTNQKAVSVLGTFLENKALLNFYFKNNITVIEMESGPYLSAITESCYDQQAPKGTIVDLNNCPFDLGIINYTSDTPYSSLQNLGDSNLGINGIEPVTLGSLAILQRIINLEEQK
ncbi:MAG: hypothetical protein PHE32_00595 [Candidatus Shapirobacteria bacterium]|nr:hypothetical protein [Candidatus Shapirobacteria bacterium]MDD4410195.1 hypothetical protein [Candidatus Shapirobacteria bacterium]